MSRRERLAAFVHSEITNMKYAQQRNGENLHKCKMVYAGRYDTPIVLPETVTACSFVGFNYAQSCKIPSNHAVHFFIDDYQFERLWSRPELYLDLLSKFQFVCTPDFSTYTDYPRALQIYNHYRKHWLGSYWQQNGITVIPTISWGDPDSYSWCFDGEPVGSAVAVSSVGTQQSKRTRELFLQGYGEMMKRLEPSVVYFYGSIPTACGGNIIPIPAFQKRFSKKDGV